MLDSLVTLACTASLFPSFFSCFCGRVRNVISALHLCREYGNEHLAIGLTCAAGFTTMLGAMVVLCLPKKDLEGGMARWRRAMAVGYAGAAGVMVRTITLF